jgi:hypothetical protein
MESITQLVTDSLTRHGFHRPVDPGRLQWSRWFRCDSRLRLGSIPSQPGLLALAEEWLADAGEDNAHEDDAGEGRDFSRATAPAANGGAIAVEVRSPAVFEFASSDDLAATLDRIFAPTHPMRARLIGERLYLRYVVVADAGERRDLCSALNRWRGHSDRSLTAENPSSALPGCEASSFGSGYGYSPTAPDTAPDKEKFGL